MKKILLLVFATIVFWGCAVSPEKKASSIIENAIKNSLYHPESYDPIGTKIDSAFAPFDLPDFYEKTLKLSQIGAEIEDLDRDLRFAKSSMAIWNDRSTAFAKNEYNEAKNKYEKCSSQIEALHLKAEKLSEEMKAIIEQGRHFIGWKATHSYRAKNNAGQTLIGETVFILDAEMTRVLAGYDSESVEYQTVQKIYEMLKDAADRNNQYIQTN